VMKRASSVAPPKFFNPRQYLQKIRLGTSLNSKVTGLWRRTHEVT
jgi:hypothetical protein